MQMILVLDIFLTQFLAQSNSTYATTLGLKMFSNYLLVTVKQSVSKSASNTPLEINFELIAAIVFVNLFEYLS
jgi:hypothetical protein